MSSKFILKPCNSIFDITPDWNAVPYLFLQIQLSKKIFQINIVYYLFWFFSQYKKILMQKCVMPKAKEQNYKINYKEFKQPPHPTHQAFLFPHL